MMSSTIQTLCEQEGFSWRTMKEVRKRGGIKARKAGYSDGWEWYLP